MATDFNKFKFVDNKPMNPQIHEFVNIVHALRASGTTFSDSFLIQSLIDRLPTSWEKFASDLNRVQGTLTLIQTISQIRLEEQRLLRKVEEKPKQPQVHNIESQPKVSHSQKKKFSYKGKKKFHNHSNSQNKTQNQYHKNKPSFKKGHRNERTNTITRRSAQF
jgi:hypothetical protein